MLNHTSHKAFLWAASALAMSQLLQIKEFKRRERAFETAPKPVESSFKPMSRRAVHRMSVRESKPAVPGPKPLRTRAHKERIHPLRDELGAFTLVGRQMVLSPGMAGRRKWVAGLSTWQG